MVPQEHQEDYDTQNTLFGVHPSVNNAEATLNLDDESFRIYVHVDDFRNQGTYLFLAKDYERLLAILPSTIFYDTNGDSYSPNDIEFDD